MGETTDQGQSTARADGTFPPIDKPPKDSIRKGAADGYREHQLRELLTAAVGTEWRSLGPEVVDKGELYVKEDPAKPHLKPHVSGRVNDIAVVGKGEEQRVYVASANGGVWRRPTKEGGTWESLMEPKFHERALDEDPEKVFHNPVGYFNGSDSLACGALAVHPGETSDQDRIYVGSGEAYGVHDSYFGVGPVVSFDGAKTWELEVDPHKHKLGGVGFYELAMDPADPDNVLAATRVGLYRRKAKPRTNARPSVTWVAEQKVPKKQVTSVVVAGDKDDFFAAVATGQVYRIQGGEDPVDTGCPLTGQTRVSLAVHGRGDAAVLYALGWKDDGTVSVCRYKKEGEPGDAWLWKSVNAGLPDDEGWNLQGDYNLTIAADPGREDRIYLGMARKRYRSKYSCGALYRCVVADESGALKMTEAKWIGQSVHADIHALVFDPPAAAGASSSPVTKGLWVGCDGGVFYSKDPTEKPKNLFEHRNDGLCTMTMEYLGQHPTKSDVLFCGSQDNGCLEYLPAEKKNEKPSTTWQRSCPNAGDGGKVLVSWHESPRVLVSASKNYVYRKGSDGQWLGVPVKELGDPGSPRNPNNNEFYPPLAAPPAAERSDLVAFGWDQVFISPQFSDPPIEETPEQRTKRLDWTVLGPEQALLADGFRSLEFASATKLYGGTRGGRVYRWGDLKTDGQGGIKSENPLELTVQGSPFPGPVTSIAVDPDDPSGNSIYVTLGGLGDHKRVHRYDGQTNTWQVKSGGSDADGTRLLPVQHNAIVVNPNNPRELFVGADVGVWRSLDGGDSWRAFSIGLPDAAVLDLKISPPVGPAPGAARRLRAATHGRGVFERALTRAGVVVIIDTSGSMEDHQYLEHAQSAASLFVHKMGVGDSLGVVAFNDDARVVFPKDGSSIRTNIVARETEEEAAAVIDQLSADGYTNMSEAIKRGAELLANVPHPRAMILLSDGHWNRGDDPTTPQVIPPNIPIHTVALGEGKHVNVLKDIAANSRGKFHHSRSAAELAGLYASLVATTGVAKVLKNVAKDLTDQHLEVKVEVPEGTREVLFSVSWSDTAVTYSSERKPAGERLGVRIFSTKDGEMAPVLGKVRRAFVGFRLPMPPHDTYTVEVEYGGSKTDLKCTVGAFVPDPDN